MPTVATAVTKSAKRIPGERLTGTLSTACRMNMAFTTLI